MMRDHGAGRLSLFVVVIVIAALAACGNRVSGDARTGRGELPSSPALQHLPRDTRAVVIAGSMSELLRKLEVDALIERRRDAYEQAVAELVRATGFNLLGPAGMEEAGLDPHGAWGLAWLPGRSSVIFAPVRDQEQLKTTIYRAAAQLDIKLETEIVAGSLLIKLQRPSGSRVLFRERTVYWFPGQGDAAGAARRVAGIESGDSLAADPRFSSAMSSLRAGADVAVFTSMELALPMIAESIGMDGAPLAFGLDIEPTSVRVKARVPLTGAGFLHRLVRNSDTPPALLAALAHEPLASLHASVNTAALTGDPWGPELARTLAPLGLDPAQDLAPLLAGDMAVAMTRSGDIDIRRPEDFGSVVDVHVLLEVRDARAAQALLKRVMKNAPLAAQARPGASAAGDLAYVLPDPDWKDYHVGIRGTHFYLSTDPSFAARIGAGQRAPGQQRGVAEVLESAGAVRASLDALAVVLVQIPMFIKEPIELAMGELRPAIEEHDAAPHSEEWRRKDEELTTARQEAWRAEEALDAAYIQRDVSLIAAMGVTAIRVELDSDGWLVHGGQFFGERGPASVLDAALSRLMGPDERMSAALEAYAQATAKVEELHEELRVLRERDRAQFEQREQEARDAGAPAVQADESQLRGSLRKQDIQQVIRRHIARIRYCYERELVKDPDLTVQLTIEFVIDAQGAVRSAEASGAPAPLAQCVVGVIKNLQFPSPKGGGIVMVSYPFTFTPEQSTSP